MIYVQVTEDLSPESSPELLVRAAEECLAYNQVSGDPELSIRLTGDEQLHQMNLEYLGVDSPTDVLAFPADFVDPDTETAYLGDILISLERASFQAQAGGHSIDAELELLVVHGVLHLLGYDHSEPEEKSSMWAAQAEILSRLGNPLSPP